MVRKYDRRGCLVEETDPNGNATNYEYNAYGQLIKKIEPAGRRKSGGNDV